MMCSVFLATSAASGHAHVNRSALVFKPFASNIQQLISRQASEAVSSCNFLGQPISIHVPNFLYIRTSQ